MPVYNGIDARLGVNGNHCKELTDPFEIPKTAHNVTLYIECPERTSRFSFEIRLTPEFPPIISQNQGRQPLALAYFLSLDGEPISARCSLLSVLMSQVSQSIIAKDKSRDPLYHEDLYEAFLRFGANSCVQLKVFLVEIIQSNNSSVDIKGRDKSKYSADQLVCRKAASESKTYYAVSTDRRRMLCTSYSRDDLPIATFTWNILPQVALENRLIIPRTTADSCFHLLPNPILLDLVDLKSPIGSENLTKGMRIEEIAKYAYDYLGGCSLEGYSDHEIVKFAIAHSGMMDIAEKVDFQEFEQHARLQVLKLEQEKIHLLTLRVLAKSLQPHGHAAAAQEVVMEEGEIEELTEEALEEEMGRLEHSKQEVSKLTFMERDAFCMKQGGFTPEEVDELQNKVVRLFAVKHHFERTYFNAKVQVLRAFAEVYLAAPRDDKDNDSEQCATRTPTPTPEQPTPEQDTKSVPDGDDTNDGKKTLKRRLEDGAEEGTSNKRRHEE